MNTAYEAGPHPTDGDLIRTLDGQLEGPERAEIESHLSACPECRERLAAFGAHARALTTWVDRMDRESAPSDLTRARARAAMREAARRAPARRTAAGSGWLRAAAAVALVALTSLAVAPVRAWVVDSFRDVLGLEEPADRAAAATPEFAERGSRVWFDVPGAVFILEIAAPQQEGAVELSVGEIEQPVAQTVDGREESFLVLPSGLKVENTRGSTASYQVSLPASTEYIQIFAGGRIVAQIEVPADAELPWARTVPLKQ